MCIRDRYEPARIDQGEVFAIDRTKSETQESSGGENAVGPGALDGKSQKTAGFKEACPEHGGTSIVVVRSVKKSLIGIQNAAKGRAGKALRNRIVVRKIAIACLGQ